MTDKVRIALDAMGGDHGVSVIIPGAALALARNPNLSFLLVGDEARIRPLLEDHPRLSAASEILHTDVAINMGDKPSTALRRGRGKSSMWLALDAAKSRRADAAVSAGNTGALMAMSRFCVRMMDGVDRPALAVLWPTLRGTSIVLDAGATIGADARQLVGFAVMGAAMARIVFNVDRPRVGLLYTDAEEVDAAAIAEDAARLLRKSDLPDLDFRGFIAGNELGGGQVDVIVTEGFTGNVALKTAEGTARQIAQTLRSAMRQDLRSKIGYVLARRAFGSMREKMDPNRANGAVFLGLDGIVIKSHGDTNAEGFASAVKLGHDMARSDVMARIQEGFTHVSAPLAE
ncbi:phosphate acyltransferase PlsX [Methylobacterium sp. NMS14P]|uniref:phosphate acyltransferase PlsX n=1 Tax=Methylobacterium sp. NMS14P TaxID=2894310 RepID=UPI0023581F6E|nr:phosphate acyltransferase PlsX [Methylobacterium sp. NMS14P]WCS24208.1 phosphate acyltransferase PlsX [Methylobacterium sp. NMS14P]